MKSGECDHIDYMNDLAQRYGFKDNSDLKKQVKHTVLAMIQLKHDHIQIYSELPINKKIDLINQFKNIKLKCACCPPDAESQLHEKFLTLDHVNNDGKEHRKELGAVDLFEILLSRGFKASEFQVLCFNCNNSLAKHGYCDHHPEIRREVRRKPRNSEKKKQNKITVPESDFSIYEEDIFV